jgi:CRP-like cAMP-binding protein
MAKEIEQNCEGCLKRKDGCCKDCFEKDTINVFKPLSDRELDFLIQDKKQILYNPGETIIKQNTSATSVVCIKEGFAKMWIESENGKSVIVKLVGKGDFITGGGLFNGSKQHFTVSSITPVVLCMIDSGVITQLLYDNSEFALSLLKFHTQQSNDYLDKWIKHTQKYMPGRVADTLLYLKNDVYENDCFSTPLTRQDLAEMSNMTKESFVRILQQFRESKIIKIKGKEIEILKENELTLLSQNG